MTKAVLKTFPVNISNTRAFVMPNTTKEQFQRLTQLRQIAKGQPSKSADMSSVACIILGGGQGTRLFPLTTRQCKPALSFGGRYRLIDIPISNSLNAGITKIFILTQFLARSLHRHIFHTYRHDAFSSRHIEVLSAEQRPGKSDWFQGTADAVRQNAEYLLETPAEFFLILSGDQLYHMDFEKMMQCTEQKDVDVWVSTLAVGKKEASRMGIMKVNEDNHIIDFYEKPNSESLLERMKTPKSALKKMGLDTNGDKEFLGSMGIYLFRRRALFDLLFGDQRTDFGKHLIPTQVTKGRIAAFVHEGYWEDIGTIESFYTANLALNQPRPPFSCHDEKNPLFTTPTYLPGPRFGNCHICSSTICEGSIIDADEITNSIVGQRTVIKKGSIIRDSYLMGNDFNHYPNTNISKTALSPPPISPIIGEECIIKKAIIDKNVCIGNRVQLVNKENHANFDSDPIFVRDGIIVVAKDAVIPDDFIF
jgi:glucose-1-phosphate adenylyltransferase